MNHGQVTVQIDTSHQQGSPTSGQRKDEMIQKAQRDEAKKTISMMHRFSMKKYLVPDRYKPSAGVSHKWTRQRYCSGTIRPSDSSREVIENSGRDEGQEDNIHDGQVQYEESIWCERNSSPMSLHGKRKEIYKYEAPWTVYAMNWSVQIVGLEEENSEFVCRNTFDHPYPTTKVMWIPDSKGAYPDLLATSGDYLRIWRVGDTETRLECLLNNNKNSDFCAPLTSFDWNEVDPNLLGTSSIDTTCTIWGLETGQVLGRVNLVSGHVKTQLIAHDKEVYDISFSRAGGAGTCLPQWERTARSACLTSVVILDVRVPCTPVARLNNHRACVNGIAWAPHSSCHICTAAEDHQALIWDIQQMPRAIEDPILAYTAEGEINNVQWATTQPDWIAICYNNCLEILRV
ncbi:hypothetical protein F7725_014266 [Dissostichus mawsoni]|uniref:Uncharacterized protein n=1 Tax=Dissostichus mawsoni TaxID=36200 RepID=A0A7J5YZS8_DISMA|nr:hypothetical protein F7725_014266 [Dissostichus mawsoni]